jgi:hypothetical protein
VIESKIVAAALDRPIRAAGFYPLVTVRLPNTSSLSATLDVASFKSSANGALGRHDRHGRALPAENTFTEAA